ncbi:MAG: SDR family oxidoreductase [Haloarculaceae archaeon]|jgi:3-oxoacyl-[acyl-carrier protein] reductase
MATDEGTTNAIVTGGARGIGRQFALRLADRGVNVAIADIDLEAFDEYDRESEQVAAATVEEEIEDRGVRSLGVRTDVTDPDQVERMVDTVVEEFGSVDVAVANAGGGVGPIDDTFASEIDPEHLHATVERNLYGTIYTCVAVAPYMKEQGGGRIVTVSSGSGREARANGSYAHYGAAKAGVIMYTKYLAQDVGEDGIAANVIAPGTIGTGRLMEAFERQGIDEVAARQAVGRVGTPEDCASVLEFLALDAPDYLTGSVVPIDGGRVRCY